MATSGNISFSRTRDQIIKDAFIEIGVDPSENISDADNQYASRRLNDMILLWQVYDLHLWLKQELTVFLQQGQYSYNIGANSTDHITADQYIETTTTSTVTTGSVIACTSVTGMNVNDQIGLSLDNGSIYWSTITSFSLLNVTIAGTIPSSSTSGSFVHTYTNTANRPLRIYEDTTRIIWYNGHVERQIQLDTRQEYMNRPIKDSLNTVVSCYYDPAEANLGTLWVWMAPSDTTQALKCTVAKQLQNFVNSGDTMDLPSEWYEAVVLGLAYRLLRTYGGSLNPQKAMSLKQDAEEALELLKGFDQELGSIRIQPDTH